MDSIDYAKLLEKDFHVRVDDALKALVAEVDDMDNDKFQKHANYRRRLEMAYEHLREWLTNGDEYVVAETYEEICKFAFSHRKACVWAVLTIKARKKASA